MKNVFALILACMVLATNLHAQRLTKKTARQIFEKSLICLKTSDTQTFIGMWKLDHSAWPYHNRPFGRKDVIANFDFMRQFIDTALTQNLPIDAVEIDRYYLADSTATPIRHTIRVWFKYNRWYYKGYGFHMEYIGDQWFIRFAPDTSYLVRSRRS